MPSPISNMMFFTFFVGGVIALILEVSILTNSFCDLQEKKIEINKNEIKKTIVYFFCE